MLRRLGFALLLVAAAAAPAAAQGSPTVAFHIPTVTSLPTHCGVGDLVYKTTATAGAYNCTATDTWTAVGNGVSSIQEDGAALTGRTTLNFAGGTITCVDNSGASRTDCTVSPTITFGILVDGAGTTLTTGTKGYVQIPVACTITKNTLLSVDGSASSGSIVFDVWKDSYANYPPTVADTITASAKPTLSSANKATDSTLTGWTTSVAAGDVVGFNIDSVTSLTRVLLQLECAVN